MQPLVPLATTGDEGSAALTPDRANKLINLGFEWACSNPNHTPWTTRFEALKEFIKRFGHAEVPMRWEENPVSEVRVASCLCPKLLNVHSSIPF